MTMVNPTPVSPELPIQNINQFRGAVSILLDNIVYHWDQLLFPVAFRDQLQKAWAEARPYFSSLDLDNQDAMEKAGLHPESAQLNLKLGIVNGFWKKFINFGGVWLDDLLDTIENIVGSIPGAESIAEVIAAIKKLRDSARHKNGDLELLPL